jgi:hypothetical protein
MMNELISQIEEARAQGAVVLLKWDGERTELACTVMILRKDTAYVWRRDCDDMAVALAEALSDYRARHDR